MSRDDDALRWEGDEELETASGDGPRAGSDRGADTDASAPSAAQGARPRGAMGWLALALAVAATVGWVVVIVANPVQQPSLLGVAMYQLGEVLAVLAPLLWWWSVDRLVPLGSRAPWWLAGLVVTAPWPLVAGLLA